MTLEHVPFGLVLGEDGKKFKTRSGGAPYTRSNACSHFAPTLHSLCTHSALTVCAHHGDYPLTTTTLSPPYSPCLHHGNYLSNYPLTTILTMPVLTMPAPCPQSP